MKAKQLLLSLIALLMATMTRADVAVNETNFPDANFRYWVQSLSYGRDRVLTESEIAGITSIDVSNKNIRSLKGIEIFTALKTLSCRENQLTELDVSLNTALKNLSCGANQLTTLDVSQNIELTELYCDENQLTSLDVSQNTALERLYCYANQLTSLDVSQNTALTWLLCYCNQIKDEAMAALVESLPTVSSGIMYVIYNENEGNVMTYEQVDVAKAKGWKLRYFTGSYWQEYAGSDPTDVVVNETNFPDMGFRNWVLSQSYGNDGVLTESEIAGVTSIYVNDEYIQSLKGIEFFTALIVLHCFENQLTALDVSQNTALKELYCFSNQLTVLDVSQNTALTNLSCSSNQLTVLDVSQNTALTWLTCYNNQLTELDVSQNTALTELRCSNNQLTSLDVSGCTALTWLDCCNNQLTALDVSQNTRLASLSCYLNQIKNEAMDALVESLPVSSGYMYVIYNENEGNVMTKVQVVAAKAKGWMPRYYDGSYWQHYEGSGSLNVAVNETNFPDANFRKWVLTKSYGKDGVLTESEIAGITSIDVSNKYIQSLKGIEFFTALTDLCCNNNQLTALYVSQNTALTFLLCSNNRLTALDVSKNTALTELWCFNNQLTALDLSKNTELTTILCHDNQLTALYVSQNAALTELWCYQNQIMGAAMDALVESLPTKSNGVLAVIDNENEQNVMTYIQVEAAKTKGWIVYRYDGSYWQVYEGDPDGINRPTPDPSHNGGEIYDLSGRMLQKMQRGINIVNGKKVLMK